MRTPGSCHRDIAMIRLPIPPIPRAAIGPVLLASLLVLLIFWRTPGTRPIIAPPDAITGSNPIERPIGPGTPMPTPIPLAGNFIRRNELYVGSAAGLFDADDHMRLAIELEQALNYTSERFGSGPNDRLSAYVGWEVSCGLHGIAYTNQRTVQVFTCPDLPRERAVTILAHEFVHQLAHDRYGPAHLQADMILLEGVATWGAGKYWLSGHPNFAGFVRQYRAGNQLLPLATSYAGRPVSDMNLLYYQWASFVEFLIDTYGRERFDALYVTGRRAPGSADYLGVYGKGLNELEQEWVAWLDG